MKLVGLTVTDVRTMTANEMAAEGWEGWPPVVVVLSDGSMLYASRDDEGNGPGSMFGYDRPGARCVRVVANEKP